MRRLLLFAAVASLSCGNEIDRSIALVTAPRILAVRAEPPESLPGGAVTYTALAATASGSDAQAGIEWSFCSVSASLTDDSPVSSACITTPATALASGNVVTLATPMDACRRFGPQGMPAQAGKPPPQPTAPDPTGGYHQPVLLYWQDDVTAALERLTCNPTGVSLDLSQTYRDTRRPNQNPLLLPLATDVNGEIVDLTAVAADAVVHLSALWSPESVESYVTIDVMQQELIWHTEKLWVAWFVAGGALDHDVSEPIGAETGVDNLWRMPATAGVFHLWTVLHDDRGGIDFAETEIIVR